MGIEQGDLKDQDFQERRERIAGFLRSSLKHGRDYAPVREEFDWLRYAETVAESAATFPPEQLTHDPTALMETATSALEEAEEAIEVAKIKAIHRYLDEAA